MPLRQSCWRKRWEVPREIIFLNFSLLLLSLQNKRTGTYKEQLGKMKNYFILPFLVFALSACKADKTEVSLRHSDIVDVFQTGAQKSVEFEK